MTQSPPTRSIIDTHRHIFGPKLRQKFVENIGFDDSKPLPQANAGEMFFYRESVDVDYSMEIQRQSGVSSCVNSYGGEVETFAQHISPSLQPLLQLDKTHRLERCSRHRSPNGSNLDQAFLA
jgi:hypothetical protein